MFHIFCYPSIFLKLFIGAICAFTVISGSMVIIFCICFILNELHDAKTCFCCMPKNKGADQPAHVQLDRHKFIID